jgi:hypothetical protein
LFSKYVSFISIDGHGIDNKYNLEKDRKYQSPDHNRRKFGHGQKRGVPRWAYRNSSGQSARIRHRPSSSNRGLTGYVRPSLRPRPTGTKMRQKRDAKGELSIGNHGKRRGELVQEKAMIGNDEHPSVITRDKKIRSHPSSVVNRKLKTNARITSKPTI